MKLKHICHRSVFGAAQPHYPPAGEMMATLARDLWGWAVSGFSAASDEEQARRLAICEACPLRNAEDRRCWRCGCFTDVKVKLRTEHCPEMKW